MNPPQHGAPSGWPQAMSLDDVHDAASMRKDSVATFGAPSPQTTAASPFIPTPISPKPEILHQPQHRYKVPVPHWANGQRPPTPPLHHLDDVQHYPCQHDPANPLRGPSEYSSPCGTFAPAYIHPSVSSIQGHPSQQTVVPRPRFHPSANILQPSHQQQILQSQPAQKAPSIQYWPTHNPIMIDAQSKKKQEEYRRKGEATRRKTVSSQASAPQYEPIKEPASMPHKRKASIVDDLTSTPAPPPRFRRLLPGSPKPKHAQQQNSTSSPVVNYHPPPHGPQPGPMHYIGPLQYYPPPHTSPYPPYEEPFHARPLVYMPQRRPHTPAAPPPPPPKIVDPETLPQHITNAYDEYKWPAVLYELQAGHGFEFAESFLQTQFEQGIYNSDSYRWDAHTTAGFIKDGNRMSILVLHNATNPFQWDPPAKSTTSIGVYGLFAHEHNEIHWTTIAPGVPKWFTSCLNGGHLTIKQKWFPNMKASDKRFHRAYWLAANRLPLNRILNHSVASEKPYGVLEDNEKDDFVITEEDLQHGWNGESVSVEESEKIWARIVGETEGVNLAEVEHMSIGGSERAFMAD